MNLNESHCPGRHCSILQGAVSTLKIHINDVMICVMMLYYTVTFISIDLLYLYRI